MENSENQNLVCRLEGISAAASKCSLNFQNLSSASRDINEVAGFLGITADQAVFFSCLTDLSFQKTVTIDLLSKHLKCSPLKLVTLMHNIEALEKKGYVHRII
jgi:hypothetical protein